MSRLLSTNNRNPFKQQSNMKQITITVGGNEYPYVETMGAMLSFKEETGVEPSTITPNDIDTNLKYMYHVTRSACRREGVGFPYTFEGFIDALESVEYIRLVTAIAKYAEEALKGDDAKNV